MLMINLDIHVITIIMIILIIISNEDWIKAKFKEEMEIDKSKVSRRNED